MGTYRKRLRGKAAYASFVPDSLLSWQEEISSLTEPISKAEQALDHLHTLADTLNEEQLAALFQQEAEDSWMLSAGLTFLPFGITTLFNRWDEEQQQEIDHLLEASAYAIQALREWPICGRLLKKAHYLMCQGPKYAKKYPGEFRTSPIWIGKEGCTLQNASFIPPTDDDLIEAFSDLEKFINDPSDLPLLVRAALIHYQFETIHPFIDANGRVGRLLNTLFLLENQLLTRPILLWSAALGQAGGGYAAELQRLHETGNYLAWIRFYLDSIAEAVERSIRFLETWTPPVTLTSPDESTPTPSDTSSAPTPLSDKEDDLTF